jgi:hypothetical protein
MRKPECALLLQKSIPSRKKKIFSSKMQHVKTLNYHWVTVSINNVLYNILFVCFLQDAIELIEMPIG